MISFIMLAPAALAALTAIPSIVKGVVGVGQLIKGAKAGKTPRPKYVRPGEIDQIISTARNQAAGVGLPGESEAMEQIEADLADVLREAQKGGDPNRFMELVAESASKRSETVQKLAIAAARDYQRRQEKLTSALQLGAAETRKEFDVNLYEPYLQAQAASSALKEAGLINIFGAIKGVSESAIQGADASSIDVSNISYR